MTGRFAAAPPAAAVLRLLVFPSLALAALAGCGTGPAPKTAGPTDPGPASRTVTGAPAETDAWLLPLERAALPVEPNLLPNAEREYRGGIHEGVDFFLGAGGEQVSCGAPVVNARTGWVVRADHDWRPMNSREYEALTTALQARRDEDQLDRLRGRQVWVQGDDGGVERYCHLETINPDVQVGVRASRGTPLGTVGNSGTRDGARANRLNCHLHFEIREPGGAYLGKGLGWRRARALYAARFGLPD